MIQPLGRLVISTEEDLFIPGGEKQRKGLVNHNTDVKHKNQWITGLI